MASKKTLACLATAVAAVVGSSILTEHDADLEARVKKLEERVTRLETYHSQPAGAPVGPSTCRNAVAR